VDFKRICITGGAGFVGSNLAIAIQRAQSGPEVTVVDSLKRRGSELALSRLRAEGVPFVHGDIRCPEDLADLEGFDLLIDCSAEPSVQAGATGSPAYVLQTNLVGTINLLEAARVRGAATLLLSTSRVYPLDRINALDVEETPTRFEWRQGQGVPGLSEYGLAEAFPLDGVRSFYGASKLASEYLLQEYHYAYGMPALIDRCGVLAGPWQMGKVDQGVVTLWVARHVFGKPLDFIGFGGTGKQVRDLLHIDDLAALVTKQCAASASWNGPVYNVGGGNKVSASLHELTEICRDVSGNQIEIGSVPDTSPMDVRICLSDARKVRETYHWEPERSVRDIVSDIHEWITSDRERLAAILG
jgi:CDP-paratose 2-epimerase